MLKIRKKERNTVGITNNGVTVHNRIISTEATSGSIAAEIARALLVFVLSVTSLMIFVVGAGIDVSRSLLVVYCALMTFICCSFNSRWGLLSKIALLVIFTLFIIFTSKIRFGFCDIINDYTKLIRVGEVFDISSQSHDIDLELMRNFAMLELATIIIPLISYGCFYGINIIIVFVCTFPFVELILYFGFEPPMLLFMLMVTGWVCAFVMQISSFNFIRTKSDSHYRLKKRSNKFFISSKTLASKNAGKTIPVTAAVCALLFFGAYVYVSLFHTRPASLDVMRANVKYAVEHFSFDDFSGSMNNLASSLGLPSIGSHQTAAAPGTPPKLGSQDGINFTDEVVLKVQSQIRISQNIYLKGYVGSVYENNSWTQLHESAFDHNTFLDSVIPIQNLNYNFTLSTSDYNAIVNNSLTIENLNATKYAYAPYNSDYMTIGNVEYLYDSYAYTDDSTYSVYYQNPSFSAYDSRYIKLPIITNYNIDSRTASYEEFTRNLYRDYDIEVIEAALLEIFTNENYLGENLKLAQFNQIELDKDSDLDTIMEAYRANAFSVNVISAIDAIGNYLNDNYYYNTSPGKTPDGEDFVKYFLEEMDSASCTYFASAGTLLMRALGFPARYVEGYIVTPEDFSGNTAEITNRAAHAWCEIYISGTGWVPVEFTPGFSANTNPNSDDDSDNPEQTTTTTTTTQAQTTTTTTQATLIAPVTTTAETDAATSTTTSALISLTQGDSNDGSQKGGVDYSLVIKNTVLVLLFIFALLTAIYCWLQIRKKLLRVYRKSITASNRNKAVIAIYRRYLELLQALGIDIDKNVTDIDLSEALAKEFEEKGLSNLDKFHFMAENAVEADMSTNTINEDNYEFCLKTLKDLETFVWQNSNRLQKFKLKYIKFYY